jgi:hypothetical protein
MKTYQSSPCIFGTSLAVFFGLAATVEAVAIAVPGLNGVTYDFFDQPNNFTLTIQGGPVDITEQTAFPNVFDFFGINWKGRLTFSLTSNPGGADTVFVLGRMFHFTQPHPLIDGGPGNEFVFNGTATDFPGTGGWTFTGFPGNVAHGGHSDRYFLGVDPADPFAPPIPFTTLLDGVPGNPAGQIGAWGFTVTGKHVASPVPETCSSLTCSVALLGLLFVDFLGKRKPRPSSGLAPSDRIKGFF